MTYSGQLWEGRSRQSTRGGREFRTARRLDDRSLLLRSCPSARLQMSKPQVNRAELAGAAGRGGWAPSGLTPHSGDELQPLTGLSGNHPLSRRAALLEGLGPALEVACARERKSHPALDTAPLCLVLKSLTQALCMTEPRETKDPAERTESSEPWQAGPSTQPPQPSASRLLRAPASAFTLADKCDPRGRAGVSRGRLTPVAQPSAKPLTHLQTHLEPFSCPVAQSQPHSESPRAPTPHRHILTAAFTTQETPGDATRYGKYLRTVSKLPAPSPDLACGKTGCHITPGREPCLPHWGPSRRTPGGPPSSPQPVQALTQGLRVSPHTHCPLPPLPPPTKRGHGEPSTSTAYSGPSV